MASANFATATFLPQANSNLSFEVVTNVAAVVTDVAAIGAQIASVFV
jgi:hypothetical protein